MGAHRVIHLLAQLWIVDPNSMPRGKLRTELLELVGAGDRQCSRLEGKDVVGVVDGDWGVVAFSPELFPESSFK